jgi:hypothetical protein
MRRASVAGIVVVVVAVLCLTAWLHDFVTLSGAKTLYTVECIDGIWQGTVCSGHLSTGKRLRFKTLRARREVLFWTVESTKPSEKLTQCAIENAKDWSCKPEQPPALVTAMRYAQPVAEPGRARPPHCVPKWKWLLLDRGVRIFNEADI